MTERTTPKQQILKSASVIVMILFVVFRLRFGRLGTWGILGSLSKIAASSGVMGAVCWAALWYSHFASIGHFLIRLTVFSSLILGATLLYLALAWVFRCHEIHEVYGIAVRRDLLQPGKIGLTGSA